jgi:ketosteroid isomerase-like protein
MSIQENVQTVKEFFAAIGRSDKQGLLALSAEDADLLQKASEMEISSPTSPEYVAQGDRVLVVGFAKGKVKATNRTFEDHFVFAITVRNGKLTNIREYVDTQALARASQVDASGLA